MPNGNFTKLNSKNNGNSGNTRGNTRGNTSGTKQESTKATASSLVFGIGGGLLFLGAVTAGIYFLKGSKINI
jgi:hypothetical protein